MTYLIPTYPALKLRETSSSEQLANIDRAFASVRSSMLIVGSGPRSQRKARESDRVALSNDVTALSSREQLETDFA